MKNPVLRGSIDATYTADFFRQHDSAFSPHIAEAVLCVCGGQVRSMLDVGCGHGFLVEAMRLRGVDAYGLEGSSAAESLWPEFSRHKYLVRDLTRLDDFEQVAKCDLVTSFEVAEHLDEQFAGHFVQTLTHHRPGHIVFGAATVYQDLGKNPTHVNERPFSYWIEQMQKCDYRLHLTKTVDLKELLFEKKRRHGISWWYPKNAMVFVPGSTIAGDPGYDAAVSALDTEMLTWRIRSKNPIFNLVAERDRYEYLHIVGAGINAAARRLRGSARQNAE